MHQLRTRSRGGFNMTIAKYVQGKETLILCTLETLVRKRSCKGIIDQSGILNGL